MPYVVRNADGLYLRRFANRSYAKREWVTELDEATIWPKSGPAKSAANFASKSEKGQAMELQEVKLMAWGSPIEIIAKKPR